MFIISVNFKDTKMVDHILESSLDVQSFLTHFMSVLARVKTVPTLFSILKKDNSVNFFRVYGPLQVY